MLNSKHLSLVNKISDIIKFTITRFHGKSYVNISKWIWTHYEIVGEKRELLVLELAVGKYIE